MPKRISHPQRRRRPPVYGITSDDRERIRFGLLLYARNARAAAGTLRGLGAALDAERLEASAEDIDKRLAPKFADQEVVEVAHA